MDAIISSDWSVSTPSQLLNILHISLIISKFIIYLVLLFSNVRPHVLV